MKQSSIDRYIDATTSWKCIRCKGDDPTECSCWSVCRCGWSYARGSFCPNPIHIDPIGFTQTGCSCALGEIVSRRECSRAAGNKTPCRCHCHAVAKMRAEAAK